MRGALSTGSLKLSQTAVTHFGSQHGLVVNPSEEYNYEYVMDCKPTAHKSALAIALSNLKLQLRNRESLALEYEFHAHNNTINEIWVSESTPWNIATCSSDEYVKFWDLRSRLPAMVIPVGHEVWSLSVGNGDTLLAAGTDVKAHFFDVRTGKKLGEYGESHGDAVTRVRFHPTQPQFVVTASEDGIVCMFDTHISDEDEAIESILNVESAVSKIGFFGPQMENIYCLTGTETLDLWNINTAERVHHYDRIRDDCNANGIPTDYLIDCVYDAQSSELFLLSGNHDGNINVVNIGGGNAQLQHAATLSGSHKACVRCVYYDADRMTLYSGGEDARLCKWISGASTSGAAGTTTKIHSKAEHDPAGLKKARKSSRPY
ncbi:Wd repeat-containing protein 89, partial [Globisporangium splendens]